ncbi:sugar transferase [Piscibacillus salipiscarius]|uniref:Sugar transferase n=1 Tax=Piscibacillus salipiscarius TaxID=299480 RepID=A0ABW5QC12_9BACI|nr:sugar transferase [Piscibacillus salipiscarius]
MIRKLYSSLFKRILDFTIAIIITLFLSPLLILLAILIKTKIGSPVIFKQQRPGLNETIFTMYKFRTMTNEVDDNGELLPDDIRLTKFGKILRSTSLDELPELFNILKGDMSIVGPRPLLVEYLNLYNDYQRRRHEVRPGLTGLAQVNGRNSLGWQEKFKLDVQYVDQVSLILDIKIMILTVLKVFLREGITSTTSSTNEKFIGNE